MAHLSKVTTINHEIFYTQGPLKQFEALKNTTLIRINNGTIINLALIISFNNGKYARLEVQTKTRAFIVSRHYAKQLKEKMSNVQRLKE